MSRKLKIKIYVPFETAVCHGFVESGYFILEPTEQELRTLTVEERQLLAEAPQNHDDKAITAYLEGFGHSTTADFSAVKPLLAAFKLQKEAEKVAREAKIAQEVEATEKENALRAQLVKALVDQVRTDVRAVVIKPYWESDADLNSSSKVGVTSDRMIYWGDMPNHLAPGDQNVLDLIRAEFHRRRAEKAAQEKAQREQQEKAAQEAKAQQEALDKEFIRRFGSAEQIERHNEGFLPEAEFLDLVRDKIFEVFTLDSSIRRYVRLTQGDVEHTGECYEGRAAFDSNEATQLSSATFAKLKHIRALARPIENVTVKAVLHTAECDGCSAKTVERLSAKVTIVWNGRKLSREYAL
jgi:hypothetical protein